MKVVGENNRVEIKSIKGSAIASGYVLKVERSNVFALDPITRQEQLMNLRPVFLEAGLDPRFLLKQLRLADLRGTYDEFDKADNRAQKILDKIKDGKGKDVVIRKYEDHIGIMGFMQRYVMTEEFDELDKEIQDTIEKHIDDRLSAEGKNRLPTSGPTQSPPGQPGMQPPDMGGQAPALPPMPPQIGAV